MGFQAEPLGFEGDGPAAAEGVEHRRWSAVEAGGDLLVSLAHQRLVAGVLPDDEPFDEVEQSLPLFRLQFLGGEAVGVRGRVVDELGEEHRPAGGERAASPPRVQRGGVAVADRLFAR